jgi:predicted O-methyltransferase YrrM
MPISRVQSVVGKLPYMRARQAEKLQELIVRHELRQCLELGFYHGVSSAYFAEIIRDAFGKRGHLTTIDRLHVLNLSPNVEQLLNQLGLSKYVTVYAEERSFTWRLMHLIEENPAPVFDFAYLDAGHTWDVTGFGFLLVDRLLRPGGWIALDDLNWTHAASPALAAQSSKLPEKERVTPQVRKVWELLVQRHPCYGEFREDGQYGLARKISGSRKCISAGQPLPAGRAR